MWWFENVLLHVPTAQSNKMYTVPGQAYVSYWNNCSIKSVSEPMSNVSALVTLRLLQLTPCSHLQISVPRTCSEAHVMDFMSEQDLPYVVMQ